MASVIPTIRDFILTYPGLEPGSQIQVMPFSPNVTEGNGISYAGLGMPVFGGYVTGEKIVTLRESYMLDILRPLIDEIGNEEITEFIRDFEKWVIKQSVRGRTPHFGSDTEYDERMWAQGGVLFMVDAKADPPFAAYRTNIIIQYQDLFEEEY